MCWTSLHQAYTLMRTPFNPLLLVALALLLVPASHAQIVADLLVLEGQAFGPDTVTVVNEPFVNGEDEVEAAAAGLSVYPNPVAGSAMVTLVLAAASEATVTVFDVLGRSVAVLHRGPLTAGPHTFGLDGGALPSGVYLVRAEVGEEVFTERVTVLR